MRVSSGGLGRPGRCSSWWQVAGWEQLEAVIAMAVAAAVA